ncbi:MAG TPA: desulfoferrodoxin [Candidatus Atribacteria bacterium]|jgi:superoxide reductase|nr:desulfoferrodoxin [Candidatus Atribacteria bacterium]
MTKKLEIYKCEICGNIVEVLHIGKGALVCCGQQMKLMEEKTADQTTEKHVPIMEKISDGIKAVVGSTLHPMEEKHYIEWIEVVAKKGASRKFLEPGDKPESLFKDVEGLEKTREYCNIHGLWTNKENK